MVVLRKWSVVVVRPPATDVSSFILRYILRYRCLLSAFGFVDPIRFFAGGGGDGE